MRESENLKPQGSQNIHDLIGVVHSQSQTEGTLSMSNLGFLAIALRAACHYCLSDDFAFLAAPLLLLILAELGGILLSGAKLAYCSLMTSKTPFTSISPWRRA